MLFTKNGFWEGYKLMTFNNEIYIKIATDLIHDIFYSNISSRGRISSIRQYTEILFRKCLDLDADVFVTVGDHTLLRRLTTYSNDNSLVTSALQTIKNLGNKYTHTQFTGEVGEDDQDKAFDALLDVSAYMFVDYFSKYPFGENNEIMSYFSYLPPIIRYKTLNNLYAIDSSNIDIIDKLSLAILKSQGKQEALNWIIDNKDNLNSVSPINCGKSALTDHYCSQYFEVTMFDVCLNKILSVDKMLSQQGLTYKNFEEAISYFQDHGKINGATIEIQDFNDLMELLYIGRKAVS